MTATNSTTSVIQGCSSQRRSLHNRATSERRAAPRQNAWRRRSSSSAGRRTLIAARSGPRVERGAKLGEQASRGRRPSRPKGLDQRASHHHTVGQAGDPAAPAPASRSRSRPRAAAAWRPAPASRSSSSPAPESRSCPGDAQPRDQIEESLGTARPRRAGGVRSWSARPAG